MKCHLTYKLTGFLPHVIVVLSFSLWLKPSFGQVNILSDNQLYDKGLDYYNRGNYKQAEIYLFALVQKNPEVYRTNAGFKAQIDRVLTIARRNSSGKGGGSAEVKGHMDEGDVGRPIPNVFGNTENVPVQKKFKSGTYTDNLGFKYYINRIGGQVWWTSADSRGRWNSILAGKLIGKTITADWADFPTFESSNHGTIRLEVIDSKTLVVTGISGQLLYGHTLRTP